MMPVFGLRAGFLTVLRFFGFGLVRFLAFAIAGD